MKIPCPQRSEPLLFQAPGRKRQPAIVEGPPAAPLRPAASVAPPSAAAPPPAAHRPTPAAPAAASPAAAPAAVPASGASQALATLPSAARSLPPAAPRSTPAASGSSQAGPVSRIGRIKKLAGRRRTVVMSCAVALGLAVFAGLAGRGDTLPQTDEPLVFHKLKRADLSISVTERGSLVSQQETRITCDVETVSGQSGTRIVYIVPNGKAVKQGDLLVEFDSAPLRERLDNQVVSFEQAKAYQVQSEVRFENQATQNETSLAAARLRVEMAELNQKMYQDGEDGTYRLALEEIEQRIQEARNGIVEAQAELHMQATSRNGVETLYKLGYRGKGDLDQAVHRHLQAEDALLRATNALANAIASRKKLEQFEHPMRLLELEGSLNTARRALVQVERDNESYLIQAQAAKTAADRALAKEQEKLDNYKEQLEKCKVFAPHEGMVAYTLDRTPWGRVVGEGELVVERFKILTLPDLGKMQVKTSIHESVLDKVNEGMPATVTIDALDNARYKGTVRSVAVLPSQDGSLSSEVKVYEAVVTIDEPVRNLKPGMTALVEIHVNHLDDVLSVPLGAIVETDGERWCYVAGRSGLARRSIGIGATNDMFAQVTSGLSASDEVVMNPMSVDEPE